LRSDTLHRFEFRAMASVHELLLAAPDRALAESAARAAIADVERIEAKYSRYRDASVVSTVNRAAGGAPVAIDAETAALLRYADACHRES
jgi:FAD:protein FMN transferase